MGDRLRTVPLRLAVASLLSMTLLQGGCASPEPCKTHIDIRDQWTQSLGKSKESPATPARLHALSEQVGPCVSVHRTENEHELLTIRPIRLFQRGNGVVLLFQVLDATHVSIVATYGPDDRLRRVYIY